MRRGIGEVGLSDKGRKGRRVGVGRGEEKTKYDGISNPP